jgi:hypothetical protein
VEKEKLKWEEFEIIRGDDVEVPARYVGKILVSINPYH